MIENARAYAVPLGNIDHYRCVFGVRVDRDINRHDTVLVRVTQLPYELCNEDVRNKVDYLPGTTVSQAVKPLARQVNGSPRLVMAGCFNDVILVAVSLRIRPVSDTLLVGAYQAALSQTPLLPLPLQEDSNLGSLFSQLGSKKLEDMNDQEIGRFFEIIWSLVKRSDDYKDPSILLGNLKRIHKSLQVAGIQQDMVNSPQLKIRLLANLMSALESNNSVGLLAIERLVQVDV